MKTTKKWNYKPISTNSAPNQIPRTRGFTVAELLIASSMFLLILGLLFFTLHQSTNTMLKGTTQSDFVHSTQVFSNKFTQIVQYSSARSTTIADDGSGMSVLSAEDDSGKFHFDPTLSQAIWQQYIGLYFEESSRQILKFQLPVTGSPEQLNPGPIESWGPSPQALQNYFGGGQPLPREVKKAVFTQPTPSTLHLEIRLEKTRAQSRVPEFYNFQTARSLRN